MRQKSIRQLMQLVKTTRNLTSAPFTFLLANEDGSLTMSSDQQKRLATPGAVSVALTIQPDALQPQSAAELPAPDRLVSFIVTEDVRAQAQAAGRETYDLYCAAGQVYDMQAPDTLLGCLYVEGF